MSWTNAVYAVRDFLSIHVVIEGYDKAPVGDPANSKPGSWRMPRVSLMVLDTLVWANELCLRYLKLLKWVMKISMCRAAITCSATIWQGQRKAPLWAGSMALLPSSQYLQGIADRCANLPHPQTNQESKEAGQCLQCSALLYCFVSTFPHSEETFSAVMRSQHPFQLHCGHGKLLNKCIFIFRLAIFTCIYHNSSCNHSHEVWF